MNSSVNSLFDRYSLITKSVFSKNFCLSRENDFGIQPITPNSFSSQNNQETVSLLRFGDLKEHLNAVKSQLSDKDILLWHQHTKNTNPAGHILRNLRQELKPEMGTQAWFKFTEILHRFPSLVPEIGEFRSFHLCEAPGAFISSLNHFIVSNQKSISWDWRASTLNPYFEGNDWSLMIPDDLFIFNSISNWEFGADDTGDLFSPAVFDSLVSQGPFDLVTADGSVDCQGDPAEQEKLTFPLHFCETVLALNVLRAGGHLVLKKFTSFESESLGLLYFLARRFRSVHFYKPCTSKGGNSEQYLVCLHFHGVSSDILQLLKSDYGKEGGSILRNLNSEIPAEFLDRIFESARFFAEFQLEMIRFNMESFDNSTRELSRFIGEKQTVVAEEFTKIYRPTTIGKKQKLCPKGFGRIPWISHLPNLRRSGTFFERNSLESVQSISSKAKERLDSLKNSLGLFGVFEFEIVEFDSPIRFEPVFGGSLANIGLLSSKFCCPDLLQLYQSVRQISSCQHEFKSVEELELSWSDEDWQMESTSTADLFQVGGRNRWPKRKWLYFLDNLLKTTQNHQKMIVFESEAGSLLLSRFSVGVVALLASLFHHVTLGRDPVTSQCSLTVAGPQPAPDSLSFEVKECFMNQSEERSLLQITPMEFLADTEIYGSVKSFNDAGLCQLIDHLIACHQ